MNRYFKELFDDRLPIEEHYLISDMICRIGNKHLSSRSWRESMSEEEREFVYKLTQITDRECFGTWIESADDEEKEDTVFAEFAEIMIYYTVYDIELSWAMPSIGLLYADALNAIGVYI